MSLLNRSFLASRSSIIPGRITVSYRKTLRLDSREDAKTLRCERRPASKSELRSIKAASEDVVETFVFISTDLDAQSVVLGKEDEIHLASGEVYSIQAINYELLHTRHKAVCTKQHDADLSDSVTE